MRKNVINKCNYLIPSRTGNDYVGKDIFIYRQIRIRHYACEIDVSFLLNSVSSLVCNTEGRRRVACTNEKKFSYKKQIVSPDFIFVRYRFEKRSGAPGSGEQFRALSVVSTYRVRVIRQLEDPTNRCRQAIVRIERKESFLPFSLGEFPPARVFASRRESRRNERPTRWRIACLIYIIV